MIQSSASSVLVETPVTVAWAMGDGRGSPGWALVVLLLAFAEVHALANPLSRSLHATAIALLQSLRGDAAQVHELPRRDLP